MDELSEEMLNEVTTFDLSNATAASLLLTTMMRLWLARLTRHKSFPNPTTPSSRVRPFIRLHEYDEGEFSFQPIEQDEDAKLDDEGLPHGTGVLKFRVSEENQESCVGNTCEGTIAAIVGTFDHGSLSGFADVYYSDGDVLRATFARGSTLHGVAARINNRGEVLSVSSYDSGVRAGPAWQMAPHFGVALFGNAKKGKVNSAEDNDVMLNYFSNETDAFALTGEFVDGILQGQGTPRRIAKAWFSNGGYMMHIEPSTNPMEFGATKHYNFRVGPHLLTQEDKFLAEAAWLWNQRYDQLEPRATIKDAESVKMQFDTGLNVSHVMPDSEDEFCKGIRHLDPALPGTLRDRWLACYPGSGSKWLLTVFRASCGMEISGVIGGFFNSYAEGTAALVKTHHQNPDRWKQVFSVLNKHSSRMWSRWSEDVDFRMRDVQFMKGRAVLLFRNPYDTLISFWNHDRSGTYDGGRNKDGVKDLAVTLQSDLFKQFVKNEILLWEEIYMDYLTVGSDLMAVHYEDMKEDMTQVERDILKHLELPIDEAKIACSLKMKHDKIKRKSRELEDPFDDEMRDIIEGTIERIQGMLKFRGLKPLPVDKYKWRKARP